MCDRRQSWPVRSLLAVLMLAVCLGGAHAAPRDGRGPKRKPELAANELLDFSDILFIKRYYLPGGTTAGNHMCDQYFGFHGIPGGGLFILENAFSAKPAPRDVLAGSVCRNGRFQGRKLPAGAVLAPDLSYDGKTILFAFTQAEKTRYKWSERSTYHLFSVKTDGSELTQLTDGPWNDFDPCWMPNGRIVFISERRGGFGRCHARPVPIFTLHSMKADGSDIVCLSVHDSNEWHPSIDNDGRIVYTRWDYIDRGFNQAHHPWVTTPDGHDPRAVHGNFKEQQGDNPVMELDVRAIPGSHKYVATAAPHHGQAFGSLILIDPDVFDDNRMSPIIPLTPDAKFPEANTGSNNDQKYATAWPLSERYYLCVYDPAGGGRRGRKNTHAIHLLDARTGKKTLIYHDPQIACLSPIPLRPRRKPPIIPSRSATGRTAAVGVANVYDSTLPFPAGTKIKHLRIIHVLPKSTPHHHQPQISYGVEKNARAVLGTVPVEDDGSAYFTLPAGISVFFQALDEDLEAVQSMKSATYVQPGERLLCMGCHEPRKRSPSPPNRPTAFAREPSTITPDVPGSNPFSFPRLVQPVLEKNCLPCHVKSRAKGKKAPDLSKGDYRKNKNVWYTSYISLRTYAYYIGPLGGYDRWQPTRTVPGQFGAKAAKLYQMLEKGHNHVRLSKADLHRIALWLDCNSDFFGAYEDPLAQAEGKIVTPSLK